ncbi:hypothetical protein [Streptomyces sp. B6B3]|uniref:nSTAND1 domain-containing NTPase n=1 Tax=Streptomyces sp. B6B3 TaxID=3153570 RepID=UPI00325D4156
MGRQEKALDPAAGPVQRFASELRGLRQRAGGLTYRVMAQRTSYTVSTLSRAASGEQLPSLPVTLAYVQACGGDRDAWERRWRAVAEQAATETVDDPEVSAPYKGLARFEPGDAERFFGRERLTEDLLGLVRARRFTALVGPSGSGKSSLLRAGLIPALQRSRAPHEVPAAIRILTPGDHPVRGRAEALAPPEANGDGGASGDTVVVVDQFEEVFTLCHDRAERASFIDLLLDARRPGSPLRVVVAVRADFYGHLTEHAELTAALNEASLLVGPMSPDELRQAIVGPAQSAGLIVERALTSHVVEEVGGEPGGLPLMSHALLETWRRRKGRTLTLAGYEAAGGVNGAVARTAEHAYTRLTPGQADLARRILLRLINPGQGAQDTRRPADRSELEHADADAEQTELVLERLARDRLITLDDTTVDLAHEALITAWPRLRGWIEADRERLRVHRRLTEDARTWEDLDRDAGALYRGSRLTAAEEAFPADQHDELTPLERVFLTASLQARRHEQRTSARAARRLRVLATALSLLLVVALVAAVVAVQQQRAAVAAQQEALSRELAAQSTALLESDPDLASLLAVQAYRTNPTPEAVTSLFNAADLGLEHLLTGHQAPVDALVFDPEGGTLATGSADGSVRLWDVTTGEERRTLPGNDDWVSAVGFSPDGRILAMGGDDGTVRVWDLATGEERRTLPGHGGWVSAVAFSADGRTLAAGSDDGTVRVWDLATGEERRTLPGHGGWVSAVAFSPNGQTLAAGSDDGTVQVWDLGTGEERFSLPDVGDGVSTVAFNPDGTILGTGGGDGTVRVWDVATGGERRLSLPGHDGRLNALAFSPDGDTLATGSDDGTVRLWEVATGDERRTLAGHDDWVSAVVFSPDGKRLATGSDDGTVRLWDLATGEERLSLPDRGGGVPAVAFSPDDGTLATGSDDGTVRLFDAATGEEGLSLPGGHGRLNAVAFSPDGRLLATGSDEGTVRLFDAATGRERPGPPDRDDWISAVAFSPDGRLLATSGDAGTVRLWDLATGEELLSLPSADGQVFSIAFSPDGEVLATGTHGGTVRLWDVDTGEERLSLSGQDGGTVFSVAFSPDGRLVASGSHGGTVRLWDVETGEERRTSPGHDGAVRAVAFSPDGDLLASGGSDGTVRLWDVETGKKRRDLAGHEGTVNALAFSADGHTLATGGDDATVRLWNTALPDAAEAETRICRALHRDFTAEERSQYLQDPSTDPVCPDAPAP